MKLRFLFVPAIVVHLVFLYAIFEVYFTSPILSGLTAHSIDAKPPAKRLVLFVADGLRAHAFYELLNGSSSAPFLRNLLLTNARWGVSHTRVPTESRPGHVALIAGFYEDVSAVARGWKENPVEFDSVFNRSRYTWSWGSPDILPMFAKGVAGKHVFSHTYSSDLEDFGNKKAHKLDTWVFDCVRNFLDESKRNSSLNEMLRQRQIVFFLHLLGIDVTGHSMKPKSGYYAANIRIVDEGVRKAFKMFEEFYEHDNATAYVFTADHGMTDWGSHGAGTDHETMTPLVAWGAGLSLPDPGTRPGVSNFDDALSLQWKLSAKGRFDVEQIDICPLLSALIGAPIPVNSFGRLPVEYLTSSTEKGYIFQAVKANYLQVKEQFLAVRAKKRETSFEILFRESPFASLPWLSGQEEHTERLIKNGRFQQATEVYFSLIPQVIRAFYYFHHYEQRFLSGCIACGFLAWVAFILTCIWKMNQSSEFENPRKVLIPNKLAVIIGLVVSVLLWLQSLPLSNHLYALLPIYLLSLSWNNLKGNCDLTRLSVGDCFEFLGLAMVAFLCIELLVFVFIERSMLALPVILCGLWPILSKLHKINSGGFVLDFVDLLWLALSVANSSFLFVNILSGPMNLTLVKITGVTVCVLLGVFMLSGQNSKNVANIFIWTSLALATSVLFLLDTFTWPSRAVSWLLLFISLLIPLLSSTELNSRLSALTLALFGPYLLMSLNYEAIFYMTFSLQCYVWVVLESNEKSLRAMRVFDFLQDSQKRPDSSEPLLSDMRRAYFVLLFTILAFCGAGNIASISSFNPNAVRCFLSIFNPFVMGGLLMLKILAPFLLVCCCLRGVELVSGCNRDQLFLMILVVCDILSLNFFFLLKDTGSWLEIGMSISHYVIAMVTTMVLIVFYGIASAITRFRFSTASGITFLRKIS